MHKAKGLIVTSDFLQGRYAPAVKAGYAKPQWARFCEEMMSRGFSVTLYEARETKSKYVTVTQGNRSFKVRFSDHPPSRFKERNKFCDFFVGWNNFSVASTDDAIDATLTHLGLPPREKKTIDLHQFLYGER